MKKKQEKKNVKEKNELRDNTEKQLNKHQFTK